MQFAINKKNNFSKIAKNYELYILLLPAFAYIIVFCYAPMYGIIIAFKDFMANLGITGSPWAGLKYFKMFFQSQMFGITLKNTLLVSVYSLLWGFPIPILFALLLNQLKNQHFKKFVQTVSFAPYFISTVVLVSMLNIFLAPTSGFINNIIVMLGGHSVNFMALASWFRTVYVVSGIWQGMGFNAIIYIAALAGVSPELHEAAIVDGASRLHRIWYIDLPSISPTIIIMLILAIGNLMSVGYDKAFLMQQGMNLPVSEIISTYVYKVGLLNAQYSFATAIGIFNSVINFVLLITANFLSRRFSETSLW
jgi:putative aldouronate transport system permease protein